MLKEKENESEMLTKLYSSHANQQTQANEAAQGDFELENKFVSAEGDFDAMSIENMNATQCSPSDLLWTQMKKQLNMRENLRNKKKELEDLIRDENHAPTVANSNPVPTQSQMQEFKEKMFNTFRTKSSEQETQKKQTNEIEIVDEYELDADDIENESSDEESVASDTPLPRDIPIDGVGGGRSG